MLVLLPWLKLQELSKVGRVCFTPFSVANGDPGSVFNDSKKDIVRIVSSYRDIRGKIINKCALGYIDEKDQCSNAIDVNLMTNAVHLLAFAALAKNKFCVQLGNYTNSSCFETIFQEFSKDSEFISIITRKRDGHSRLMGLKHGELKLSIPLECANIAPPVFDNALLISLGYVLEEKDPLARRLMQSIWLYNLACSDSNRISLENEIIFMISAFERLFSNCQGADDLACKISTLLDSYGSIIVDNCSRINQINLTSKKEKIERQWFIHRKWMQELYQLRNDYIHGNDTNRKSWGWDVLEHSLMAAFVFPLIVKILIAKESKHTLAKDDEVRMGAIDILLNTQDWFKLDPATGISTWQKTISDYIWHSHSGMAIEKVIKKQSSQDSEMSQQ